MRAIHQKSDSLLRWAVLVCGCIALISNYYCYDNPAALKTQLIQSTGMSEEQFALVYSVYSLPNIVLPFFGGHLCDVFGPGPCLVVFSLCLVAGQVIFALGVSTSSVSIVLVGRAVYGLGGENMTVALSTLLASWFRGKEMALAMGLFVALARLGSVFNNFASPIISRATNISTAIWFGAVLLGAGVAACCTIVWAERAVARQMRRGRFPPSDSPPPSAEALSSTASSVNGQPGTETASMATPLVGAADDESPKTTHNPFAAILRFRVSFWLLTVCCLSVYGCVLPFNNVASSLLMERDFFRPNPDGCHLANPNLCESATNRPDTNFSACPVGGARGSYAPPLPDNATIGGVVYNASRPLTPADVDCTSGDWSAKGSCTHDFCQRQIAAELKANTAMSIPYMISACSSPFIGAAIDRFGCRALLAALCPLILIATHLALGLADGFPPTLPLVGQGVGYSVFGAALWPSVPLTIPPSYEGLAYGMVTAVQNGGLGGFPLLVSTIFKHAGERYIPFVELLFVGFATTGFLSGLFLNCYDAAHGFELNRVHTSDAKPSDGVQPLEAVRESVSRGTSP